MCEIIILEPRRPRKYIQAIPRVSIPLEKHIASVPEILEEGKAEKSVTAAAPSSPSNNDHDVSPNKETSDKQASAQLPKTESSKASSGSIQHNKRPEIIRRIKVKPAPTKSQLPKKVRFAMDMNSSRESRSSSVSSSSASSDTSYTDPPNAATSTITYSGHNASKHPKMSSLGSKLLPLYLSDSLVDQLSDSDSDCGSAIDCGEDEFPRPGMAPGGGQNGWLGSSSPQPEYDSRTKAKDKAFPFPPAFRKRDDLIFVYRRKNRHTPLSEAEPIYVLHRGSDKKKLGSLGQRILPVVTIDRAEQLGGLTNVVGKQSSKKQNGKRAMKASSSYKPPSVTEIEAEEAVHFDPALGISWRSV